MGRRLSLAALALLAGCASPLPPSGSLAAGPTDHVSSTAGGPRGATPVPPVPSAPPVLAVIPAEMSADGADASPRVIFPRGSAQLPAESGATIRAVVEALKAERSRTVLLVGYSDHWGSREISLALAVRRVDVVAKELLRQGVPGGQIRKLARGYLKSVLAQCRGPACERRLQQVELHLVDKAGRELAGLS